MGNEKDALSYTTFGIFNPISLGITLENFGKMEKELKKEQKEINAKHFSNPYDPTIKKQISEHRKKFNLYYRVRAHEKCHYFTSTSSSVLIARWLANGDTTNTLHDAIKKFISNTNSDITLPLGRWAFAGSCPESLSNPILLYMLNRKIDIGIDGEILNEHFINNKHIFNDFFPDLTALGNYWDTSSYRIGVSALVEGMGKAAEWIYFLHEDPSLEKKAWQDIRNSPEIYQLAFNRLTITLPHHSLMEYLRLLCLIIDYSLNPWIDENSWPFVWWGQSKGRDILPGFRFERILQLLRENPNIEMGYKEAISSNLSELTKINFGWPAPEEVNAQMLKLLKNAKSPYENLTFEDYELWDQIETVRNVYRVKMSDPFAFVPMVNADEINASRLHAVLLTSDILDTPDKGHLKVYIIRSLTDRLINDITYKGSLTCPAINYSWIFESFKKEEKCMGEGCPALSDRTPMNWIKNPKCGLYKALITYILGDQLNRIRFFN